MTVHVTRETASLPLNIQHQIEQKREGRRRKVHHGGLLCSRCLVNPPRSPKDRYCADCRAKIMQAHRHARTEELKRLRALEEKLSKGNSNGQIDKPEGAPPPGQQGQGSG